MLSHALTLRDTDVFDVKDLGREFLYPERVRIQLHEDARKAPFDIGSIAYSRRNFESDHVLAAYPIAVDLSSLVPGRRELIRDIIDGIYSGGLRHKSILAFLKKIKVVMDWCDQNGHSQWHESLEQAGSAYVALSDHLKHLILVDRKLSPTTCGHRQQTLQTLIELKFPGDAAHVTSLAPAFRIARNPATPPSEDLVQQYVSTCIDIARKLTDFVLKEENFPFRITVANNEVAVFPSMVGWLTPLTLEEGSSPVYNAGELRISSVEEYQELTGYNRSVSIRALEEAQQNIDAANSDKRHQQRIRLASMAASAYACLFVLITAANPSEFIEFDYLEAVEVEKSVVKKELTSVKFRAGGRITRYAVGRRTGLPLLREYLKLREWILNGAECQYLFFKMKRTGFYTGQFSKLNEAFSSTFFKRLQGVFLPADCKNIPGSPARKLKSLILHELRVSPSIVAEVMNHSQKTNAASYSETRLDRMKTEYGDFWNSVRKAAEMVKSRADGDSKKIASGHCDDFERPVKILESVPITPDCRSQYGCLFCANYLCHADEEDIHKLLSLQFVVNAVRLGSPDIGHAEQMFQELSVRIEFILDAIAKRSENANRLVESVKYRVHELGELTHFWEKRLQRYEQVGVVF